MKCLKCHTTMNKEEYSRTATCPSCGRTVHYRTKSEKRGFSSYNNGESAGYSVDGCASVLGIGALIVIAMPLIILGFIFGDGFWSFLGSAISFILEMILNIVYLIFEGIWWIFDGLLDLIF